MRPFFILISALLLVACSQPETRDETPTVTEADIAVCSDSSQCVIVDYSHCCGSTKRAINSEHLDAYNAHPEWQRFDDPDECAVIGQCLSDEHVTQAECLRAENEATGFCALAY